MLNRAKLPDNIDDLKALLSAQLDKTQALREAHRTLKEEHQVLRVERDLLRQEKQFDKQDYGRQVARHMPTLTLAGINREGLKRLNNHLAMR